MRIICHAIKMAFRNNLRAVLTVLGIIISSCLFTVGITIIESFIKSQEINYNEMNTEENLISKDLSSENIIWIQNNLECKVNYFYKIDDYLINDDNREVHMNIFATTRNFKDFGVPSVSFNTVYMNKIVEGRYFDESDEENNSFSVIINEYLAAMFFGEENPINGYIYVQIKGTAYPFKVVGVIKNTIEDRKNVINNDFEFNAYIPEYLYNKLQFEKAEKNTYHAIQLRFNNEEAARYSKYLKSYFESQGMHVNIMTATEALSELNGSTAGIRQLLLMILLFLLLLSSINMANFVLFSIKERINEIGIKKALGASNDDIVLQFNIEFTIVGVIGAIIGIIIGLLLSLIIMIVQANVIGALVYTLTFEAVVVPFALSTLLCAVSSFIPAINITKKDIVSSLRFD